MSFLKYLVMGSVAVSVAGCAFKKDGDKAEKKEVITQRDAEHTDYEFKLVKGSYRPQPELNRYLGVISWAVPKDKIIKLSFEGPMVIPTTDGSLGEVTFPLKGGERTEFKVTVWNSIGGFVTDGKVIVEAPRDLEIDDLTPINDGEYSNYGRLILTRRAVISTTNHNLTISADDIEAERGARFEFITDRDTTSLIGSPTLTISAQKAVGDLEIQMRGQDGKTGKSGRDLDQTKSDPSLNGKPGLDSHGKLIDCSQTLGAQGAGFTFACPKPIHRPEASCISQGTDGTPGLQGAAGLSGDIGFPGIDTGNLEFKVADTSNLTLILDLEPGHGGKGGSGGLGSLGGLGGKAGAVQSFKDYKGITYIPCSPTHDGMTGIHGPSGRDGQQGPDGKIGKINMYGNHCILLAESAAGGNCSH